METKSLMGKGVSSLLLLSLQKAEYILAWIKYSRQNGFSENRTSLAIYIVVLEYFESFISKVFKQNAQTIIAIK